MAVATQLRNGRLPAGAASDRADQHAFLGVIALLSATSVALTIIWSTSMAAMGGMPMPGGWTMSMAWMRMPGQTWANAGASFLGMWFVMMIAMMMPSVAPVLWRYQRVLGRIGEKRPGRLTTLMAIGYFFVWAVLGIAVFPVGVALANFEMHRPALARAVPILGSMVILIAGLLQFTAWKTRQLACCRAVSASDGAIPADARAAWKHGLRLGVHCNLCCAGLTAILLIGGVMNLPTMAIVGSAITLERLAPPTKHAAQAIGVVIIGAGLFLILRAVVGIG